MSDHERDQQDKSAEDAKEDLELEEGDADQVRGGAISKTPVPQTDKIIKI